MIHKNWAELIKPMQLEVKPGNDPSRQATLIAEPSRAGLWPDIGQRLAPRFDVVFAGRRDCQCTN